MDNISPLWVEDSIFYEIFPDRFANGEKRNDPKNVVPWNSKPTRNNYFGGDLQGILDKLDYLQDLGINSLYLTPIFQAHKNHKYDTIDYFSIDPSFGDNKFFKKFVEKLHNKKIKIILDGVFNHCGDHFWAFKEIKINGESSLYQNWFNINSLPIQKFPPNYKTCGGVSYLPKLNLFNPDVRKYLLSVAEFWIKEFDIDGWRLDTPWKVPISYWKEFNDIVKKAKPDSYIVGEIWRDPKLWLDQNLFDGVMNYLLRNLILDYCIYNKLDAEDFDFECNYLLNETHKHHRFFNLNLLDSHDTARILSECKGDTKKLVLALSFIFTYVGAPMIYYGDEIGLDGENDPDCRKSMPWEKKQWKNDVLDIYKKLITLRKNNEVLRKGSFESLLVFNGLYAYRRKNESEEIVVILNPKQNISNIVIPINSHNPNKRFWYDIYTSRTFIQTERGIVLDEVKAKESLILQPRKTK